jgi:hypothetical protein
MTHGFSSSIFYYNTEGRQNINTTVELSIKRAKELNIKALIVFTANGEGALIAKKMLKKDTSIRVMAATFPYKHPFFREDKDGNTIKFTAETSDPEVKNKLQRNKIDFIQGIMPFQEIVIPGSKDIRKQAINHTLSLFSSGLKLCVQGILMATDGGYVEPGDYVVSMSADTSIVARSSSSLLLFHPTQGLDICEIICKPRIIDNLSLSCSDEKS